LRWRPNFGYQWRQTYIFIDFGDWDFDADFRQLQQIVRHDCRHGPFLPRFVPLMHREADARGRPLGLGVRSTGKVQNSSCGR